MEVLDLRTYRDLQYVRNTESLMKVVDGKLKVASDNPRSLNPKGFQVIGCLLYTMCVVFSSCYEMLYCSPCAHKLYQMHGNLSNHSSKAIRSCDSLTHRYKNKIPKHYSSHVQRRIHIPLNN